MERGGAGAGGIKTGDGESGRTERKRDREEKKKKKEEVIVEEKENK